MSEGLEKSSQNQPEEIGHVRRTIDKTPPYWITLTAELPENLKTPRPLPERPKVGDQLAEAEVVAKFPSDIEDILTSKGFMERVRNAPGGVYRVEVDNNKNGSLSIPATLPEPVISMVEAAYLHEIKINPEVKKFDAFLDVRLQSPSTWFNRDSQEPHFDFYDSKNVSLYLLSSAPTTVQYQGTLKKEIPNVSWHPRSFDTHEEYLSKTDRVENPRATSFLPWTLYHSDGKLLHSEPWGLFTDSDPGANPEQRLFFRLVFSRQ